MERGKIGGGLLLLLLLLPRHPPPPDELLVWLEGCDGREGGPAER